MKKALISPTEIVYDYKGNYLGERIAEVSDNEFPVAPPLYWIDCDNNVTAELYYFNTTSNLCELIPVPVLSDLTYQEKLNVKFESYEKPRKWVYWVNDINGEWSTRLDYLL
jgi:hypothetical protein